MNVLRKFLVLALVLIGASSAFADTFTSTALRFSANFPGSQVEQGADEDNATNGQGQVISKLTSFQDVGPGRYIALIMADTYILPTVVDQNSYLSKHVREFAEGVKATDTQKSDTTVDGSPAIQFSFTMPNQVQGKGLCIFVPGEKPRGFMIVALRLAGGSADDQAKLDAFLSSFDIQ
jgi:hypothetical protein